jgi:hypothetical protein
MTLLYLCLLNLPTNVYECFRLVAAQITAGLARILKAVPAENNISTRCGMQ